MEMSGDINKAGMELEQPEIPSGNEFRAEEPAPIQTEQKPEEAKPEVQEEEQKPEEAKPEVQEEEQKPEEAVTEAQEEEQKPEEAVTEAQEEGEEIAQPVDDGNNEEVGVAVREAVKEQFDAILPEILEIIGKTVIESNAVKERKKTVDGLVAGIDQVIRLINIRRTKRERALADQNLDEKVREAIETNIGDLNDMEAKIIKALDRCGVFVGSFKVGDKIDDDVDVGGSTFSTIDLLDIRESEASEDPSVWRTISRTNTGYYYVYGGEPVKGQEVAIFNRDDVIAGKG